GLRVLSGEHHARVLDRSVGAGPQSIQIRRVEAPMVVVQVVVVLVVVLVVVVQRAVELAVVTSHRSPLSAAGRGAVASIVPAPPDLPSRAPAACQSGASRSARRTRSIAL